MYKHSDFNKEFLLQPVLKIDEELESQFIKHISLIDNDLIEFNEMNIPHDLKGFYTETQFDFAFIDSGHDEETLTTELEL